MRIFLPSIRRSLALIASAIGAVTCVQVQGQPCERFWLIPDPFSPMQFGNPFTVFDDGAGPALYVQAYIPNGTLGQEMRIARWKGHSWQILDQGLPPLESVACFALLDEGTGPRLHALVGHPHVPPRSSFVRWNGASWEASTPGLFTLNPDNVPVCTFDDGTGPAIYGLGEGGIKRWDGSQWHVIGLPTSLNNFIMQVFDLGSGPSLCVFGQFDGIEGIPNTQGAARWDGQQWHALGTGINVSQPAACVFDSGQGKELWVGGGLFSAGGTPARVARWNGQQWSVVPFPSNAAITQMVVFNDGKGPALMCMGPIPSISGQPARGFVKFDGQNWHVMPGSAPSSATSDMIVFNEDPRGPSIFMYNGNGAWGIGQFVGCAGGRTCYADCDNTDVSPRLTANDFQCFLNRFVARLGPPYVHRDSYADCNQDRAYNAADFQCYLNKFAQGCLN